MTPEGVAVLRMHVVRAGGVDYYVRDLVPGRSEGTGVAGESPGVWTGQGCAVLGVRSTVAAEEFSELLAGRDPHGERTLRTGRGSRSVSGVDLLFCAPKSVSLLHMLGPRELSEATGAAHRDAVADTLGYLEREVLGVRRTRAGGTAHLSTTGAVAAAFVHRTSRSLDPHLHTHLVTANVAQGVDGLWSSVDTRRLFHHRRPLEALYGASLRDQLSDRLGVAWERGATGRWELAGVDPVLSRLFSQRAASIDEHVFRSGVGSPGRRRVASHVDRPAKEVGRTVADLRVAWRRRAADHDLDPADLVRVVGRARTGPDRRAVDPEELSARLALHAGRNASLGRRDLVALVAESSPAGLRAGHVEIVAAAVGRAAGDAGRAREVDRGGGPATTTRSPTPAGVRWDVEDIGRVLDVAGAVGEGLAGGLAGDPGTLRSRSTGPIRGPERDPGLDGDGAYVVRGRDGARSRDGRERIARW